MKTVILIIVGIVIVLAAGFLLRRNRAGQSKTQVGTFSILQGNIDGRPMFATIDMGLLNSSERQVLPFFLSVSTPLVDPTVDGLPTRSDAEDLNAWEEVVEANLRPAGKLVFVGRVTWNGHRELLYYLSSEHPAVDALQTLLASHSTRSFAFRCERDEKWTKADLWLKRQ